ncbi:MAG: CoA transferase [Chloroflexota bacterium]|nr:CoA transferase [Chloroflexota bacterium]
MVEKGVLNGVRVLTLEQVHALPWGTGFLADLGADVIRVESPDHLQDRKAGPFPGGKAGEEWWNEAGNLVYYGTRNKRSLCMDVTHPGGKEVFLKLVEKTDIVTDNFRPGTMQRFGFDHESLSAINPRIITLSSTAYGYTGPWRRAGSRARTVDAACGLSYLTGYEGGPSMRASNNYMDHSVGNNVAYALLLALYQRNRTGQGMRIDLTMLETGVSAVGPAILEAQNGITRERLGCAHWWKAPHNVYPALGDDRWIVIVVSSDEEWERLKIAMGSPDWADEDRFATVLLRWQNRHALDELLGEWTSRHDDVELAQRLQRQSITAGSCLTAQDLVNDPHLDARGYLWEFPNPQAPRVGPRVFAGRPFRDPGNPMAITKVAGLGQDNAEILSGLAGLSSADIEGLEADGVIFGAPRPDESPP